MANKFGLGRGLSSLIPDRNQVPEDSGPATGGDNEPPVGETVPVSAESENAQDQRIKYIDPKLITTSHFQPRQLFEHTALEELVNSIKEYGILEPLIVSPVKNREYQLVAGERRLRAAKILDLPEVPVIIRSVSEQQRLEISLIENVQRRDLTPMEEANAYKRLIDEFNLTQEELAKKVGKSRSKIANSLRLLTLPEEIQQLLASGRLSEGHAKVILELSDPQEMIKLAKRVLGHGLSVRETEKSIAHKHGQQRQVPVLSDRLLSIQDELAQFLKTKVRIKAKKDGGILEIEYYSQEELDAILNKISGNS